MLLSQFQYKQWSDQRMLAAIQDLDQIKFSENYAFICQQLNHMRIVEDLFMARLLGEAQPHPKTNSVTTPNFNLLKQAVLTSDQNYLKLIQQIEKNQLQKQINFTFTDEQKGSMQVQEILFHIIHHGAYHRGSIARALDQSEVTHPADSYTMFLHVTQSERRNHSSKSSI